MQGEQTAHQVLLEVEIRVAVFLVDGLAFPHDLRDLRGALGDGGGVRGTDGRRGRGAAGDLLGDFGGVDVLGEDGGGWVP